jgi:hypothetical protein
MDKSIHHLKRREIKKRERDSAGKPHENIPPKLSSFNRLEVLTVKYILTAQATEITHYYG